MSCNARDATELPPATGLPTIFAMVARKGGSSSHTKPSNDTEADLRARLAAAEAKLAALQPAKKEAPKKKRATDDTAGAEVPKKQKTAAATPAEIIDELVAIGKLPYMKQDEAKLKRPEWFEFRTSCMRSDREVRKKANELLHGTPGMTKTKLCLACGISGVGLLNKFLENKSRNCAEDSLSNLIDILESEAEGEVKRRRRLQSMLKHGMAEPKWSLDKLARFRKTFPGIELE